jgi:hypothetical protein
LTSLNNDPRHPVQFLARVKAFFQLEILSVKHAFEVANQRNATSELEEVLAPSITRQQVSKDLGQIRDLITTAKMHNIDDK